MKRPAAILFLVLLLLAGCVSSPKAGVGYILSPEFPPRPEEAIAVRVSGVELPDYLDRLELVRRIGRNQIQISQYGRWASNLRNQLRRLLGEMLHSDAPNSVLLRFRSFTGEPRGFRVEGTAIWANGREQPFAFLVEGDCGTDEALVRKADEALARLAAELNGKD